MRTSASYLLAGAALLGGATHATAEPTCRPDLVVRKATLSEVQHMRRTWTARILVDAGRCASASGAFTIAFVRLKENAPDLQFSEPFTWAPGEIEVSTDLATDEALLRYSISAAPCPCR